MSEQTSRTNITEALRAEFQRRGWSITMSDNGQSVLDPFPVVAALAAEPSEPTAFGPRPSRGFTLDEEHYFDVWPPRSDAVTAPPNPSDSASPDEPSTWKELIAAGRASGIETAQPNPSDSASPDEPSTEAGRLLVDVANDLRWSNGNPVTRDWLAAMVADIEARAASASVPPLDVERLERAMRVSLDMYGWDLEVMAEEIAAAYAAETPEQGRGDE